MVLCTSSLLARSGTYFTYVHVRLNNVSGVNTYTQSIYIQIHIQPLQANYAQVILMLGHRLRRWPNIKPILGDCLSLIR